MHFVPLDADLFSAVRQLRPDDDTLVVVPGAAAVSDFLRDWRQHADAPAPDTLSLVQLKERLLRPASPLIPSFLRLQTLDDLMDDDLRRRFHVFGDNSLRRFTDGFFWLFETFREQRVTHVGWEQLERGDGDGRRRELWERLVMLRERYARELKRLGLTDVCLLGAEPSFEGFRWKRCILVNLLRATPLERELLQHVRSACATDTVLQGPPAWFEGEKLRVDPLSHPPAARTRRLDVVRAPDETTLMLAVLGRLDPDRPGLLFDDAFARRPWSTRVDERVLGRVQRRSMRLCAAHRLLSDLSNLADAVEFVSGEPLVEAAAVERAVRGPVGEGWLGDRAESAWRVVNRLREKRFYLHADLREISGGAGLAGFAHRLRTDMTWSELRDWLWSPPLSPDAMGEQEWEVYFDTLAAFIAAMERTSQAGRADVMLRRFTHQLGLASTTRAANHAASWRLLRMEDGLASPPTETAALVDLTEGGYPAGAAPAMLFTQQEMQQLGCDPLETTRQWQRYAFWRAVCQSEIVLLAPRENIDQNVTPSGLIEEALLWAHRLGLDGIDETLSPDDVSVRAASRVLRGDEPAWSGRAPDRLSIPFEPLRDGGEAVRLSPSSAPGGKPNAAAFFLRVCARLRKSEPVEGLDARIVGEIMHRVVERLIESTPSAGLAPLLLDNPALRDALTDCAAFIWRPDTPGSFHLAAPAGFERIFFDEVLLPFALHNTTELLASIAAMWGETPVSLRAEVEGETVLADGLPFALAVRGRADLLADSDERRWIIDFKSGSGDKPPFEQLRAYETLFGGEREVDSRFAYIMTQGLIPPPPGEHSLGDTLRQLFADVAEAGAWNPPDKPDSYDDFAPLYRLDISGGEEA